MRVRVWILACEIRRDGVHVRPGLSERQRTIIRAIEDSIERRGYAPTMREIGERLRLDESRISQIHKGALRTILEYLKMSGIRGVADL